MNKHQADRKRRAADKDPVLDRTDEDGDQNKRSKPDPIILEKELKCSRCGKSDFLRNTELENHVKHCTLAQSNARTLTLRPNCLQSERERLSDFNYLVTESIELVELSASGMEQMKRSNRQRKPEAGNIGIRCRHCAEKGVSPAGSETYPATLNSLGHNIYNLTKRHLVANCQNITEDARDVLIDSRKHTTSQSMEKERVGLPVYLNMVASELGLMDIWYMQGIQCVVVARESAMDVGCGADEDGSASAARVEEAQADNPKHQDDDSDAYVVPLTRRAEV